MDYAWDLSWITGSVVSRGARWNVLTGSSVDQPPPKLCPCATWRGSGLVLSCLGLAFIRGSTASIGVVIVIF